MDANARITRFYGPVLAEAMYLLRRPLPLRPALRLSR